MKEASIYIVSGIRGPWKKNGHIGYVLEYYPESSKYPRTKNYIEPVEEMNENRSELEALIRAITRFREKCVLSIYTESEYLYNGFAGPEYVSHWIRSGWQTAKKTEVKNRDKWQELVRLLQGNMYQFRLKERNAYTDALTYEISRKENIHV